MNDRDPGHRRFVEPKAAGSIAALLTDYESLAPDDPKTAEAFFARWRTDVRPVHERTERSRSFRTLYIALGVVAAVVLNAVGFFVAPLYQIGEAATGPASETLGAQRSFLAGLAVALLELTLWFIVLDTDVMRQKRERLAARLELAMQFRPDLAQAAGAFKDKVRRVESFYWRVGVGLTWTNVVLQVVAFGLFVLGGSSVIDAVSGR